MSQDPRVTQLRQALDAIDCYLERFFERPVQGTAEEVVALHELGAVLRRTGMDLEAIQREASPNSELSRRLLEYREALARLLKGMETMLASAVGKREGLQSRQCHLHVVQAWHDSRLLFH